VISQFSLKNILDVAGRASRIGVVIAGTGNPRAVILNMCLPLRMLESEEPPWKRWYEILPIYRSVVLCLIRKQKLLAYC
jgi:hypothetical protein